jgi:hypothetical protein
MIFISKLLQRAPRTYTNIQAVKVRRPTSSRKRTASLTQAIAFEHATSHAYPINSDVYVAQSLDLESNTNAIDEGEGTGNNYAYLVSDDKTKESVIIDPAHPSEYANPSAEKFSRANLQFFPLWQ